MLHQNWFMDSRFEMFEDYGDYQSFYDKETENIYIVYERYGQEGSTIIQEITKEAIEYKIHFEKYKAFAIKEYHVKLIMSEEYVVKAHNPDEAEQIAIEKFGSSYLVDETVITEIKKGE